MTIDNRTATATESASATSVQATLPTGTTTNDVVVAFLTVPGTSTGQHSGTPSGWTELLAPTLVADNNIISAYYRVKDAGWSTGPTVSTTAAASRTAATCQSYINVNTANPLDSSVSSAATAPHDTSITIPGVTTATNGARLVSGAICDSSTADFSPTAPSGMTRIATTNGTGDGIAGRGMSLADEVRATAGATGDRTWSTGVSLGHGGFLIALRPAIDATPTPSTVAATAAVPAPTIVNSVPATTVPVTAAVPAPVILTGDVTVPASPVSAVVSVPAPTVVNSVSTGTVNAVASVPAPTVQLGVIVSVSAVAATVGIPAPSLDAVAKPSVVACQASVPAPVVTAVQNVSVPATAVTAVVQIPSVQIVSSVTVAPAAVVAVAQPQTVAIDTAGIAKIEVLTDRFSREDPVYWTGYEHANVTTVLGNLAIGVNAPGTIGLQTNFNYTLAESSVYIEVPNALSSGSYLTEMYFGTSTTHASIRTSGGSIVYRRMSSGVSSDTSESYDPVAHRWWKLSKSGSIVTWSTSPDGTNWTVRRSLLTSINLSGVKLNLIAGYTGSENTATALFDNLNLPDVVVAPSGVFVQDAGWWLEAYDVYSMELQTKVYDYSEMSFLDPVNEEGFATVKLSRTAWSISPTDPDGNAQLLPNGQSPTTLYTQPYLWKFVYDGVRRFAGILENNDKFNAKMEDNDDYVVVKGSGIATVLSWGVCLPVDLNISATPRIFTGTNWATVWLTLFREAQTRGAIPLWVTPTFDEYVDSNGETWPDYGDYEVKPGQDMRSLLMTYSESIVFDWHMTPEGYLVAAQNMGVDRSATVLFHEGHDIWESESHQVGADVKSDVFIERGDGFISYAIDTSTRTTWGHREVYVQAGNALGDQMGDIYAQGMLAQVRRPVNERRFTINPNPVDDAGISLGRRVYTDYGPGDFIGYHQNTEDGGPTSFKLLSIAIKVGADGVAEEEIITDSKREAFAERIRRLLQANYGGNYTVGNGPGNDVTGGSSTLDAGIGDEKVPGVVTITSVTSASAMGDNGVEMADVTVTWTQPTNTDASTIVDGDHYEIGYKLAGASEYTIALVAWDQTSFTINGLIPNTHYDIRIRAVDYATPQNYGAWSAPTDHLTVIDTTAPSIPAAPTVAASMTGVQITHTLGIFTGGTYNLPSDLDHLEVHAGTTFNFAVSSSTLIGRMPANKGLLVAQIPAVASFKIDATTLTYFRVIAVDKTGNRSSASGSASATALLIDDAHISDLTASKITAGTISANLTLSGSIKTATSGARVEIDLNGIRLYNSGGTVTVDFDASDGSGLFTGTITGSTITGSTFQTAASGQRIVIDPSGFNTIWFYGSTGNPAYINAPGGSALGLNSDFAGGSTRSRLVLWPSYGALEYIDTNQDIVGGRFVADTNVAQMKHGSGGAYVSVGPDAVIVSGDPSSGWLTGDHSGMYITANGGDLVVEGTLPTTGNSPNVYQPAGGSLQRSTSSRVVKTKIVHHVPELTWKNITGLAPVTFYDKRDYETVRGDETKVRRQLGLIAEEVAEVPGVGPLITSYDYQGRPQGVNYDRLPVAYLPLLLDLHNRLLVVEGRAGERLLPVRPSD